MPMLTLVFASYFFRARYTSNAMNGFYGARIFYFPCRRGELRITTKVEKIKKNRFVS